MKPTDVKQPQKFGTFGGVFTPCTLTILGVIMFLRFGEVVGQAGLLHALLIIAMAKLITTTTALSLSAISTNTQVKGGGAYYLISRSLGSEFGGAIGVVFYVSQAISVALYVIGFTEALVALVPTLAPHMIKVATVVNFLVFLCVYIGAGWTIRLQYFILAVLGVSILSFAVGAGQHWNPTLFHENMSPQYTNSITLWTMFALFFPAATGIMAGANMSGDLAQPSRAIPKGTLLSILVTAIVYAGFAVLLSGTTPSSTLQQNMMIVSDLALWKPLIIVGIFAATLSSALGSMMGAPRILQALARDGIFKPLNIFAHVSGKNREPRRAAIASFILAQAGVMIGDLNAIAPIITMFFMITYGALNLATFLEAFSGNPSYRPTFRWCHWSISLIGTLLCLAVMFLIDPAWAIVAIVIMTVIYRYLLRQGLRTSWGDVTRGSLLERARRNLLALEQKQYHAKNWRPSVIVMGSATMDRLHMAVLARHLAGSHGLLILGQVMPNVSENLYERHANKLNTLRKLIADSRLQAFPAVTIAETIHEGISSLVQCSGIGALRPNLVMLGWSTDPERREQFLANLSTVDKLGRSIAIVRYIEPPQNPWDIPEGTIDVWWLGQENGVLMLLLAHILTQNPGWRNHHIRLMRMIPSEQGISDTEASLAELADSARIKVEVKAVAMDNFSNALHLFSAEAALVLLGLPHPQEMTEAHLTQLERTCGRLPRVLMVHSAGDMSLQT